MGHLLDVLITIAVFIFAITQIWAFGKAFLKRQSAEQTNRMPSFGGDGPGGWVKREMNRRSAAGNQPGTRPSFGGGQPAVRTEKIPADAGYRPPVRNDAQPAETHFEGYEKETEWEARKQMYARQDQANLQAPRHQTDEEKKLADNLRRGIIWAEIIGPPRAKRPYRR